MIGLLSRIGLLASLSSSIVLDQPNPTYGDPVTFTVIYPQAATTGQHHPQFHDQPMVQIDCSSPTGEYVFRAHTTVASKQKLASGWWQGVTYPVTLAFSVPATCTATLYYFDRDVVLHVLATVQFTVGA